MFFSDAASIYSSFIIPLPVKCPLLDELLIENLFPHVPPRKIIIPVIRAEYYGPLTGRAVITLI